MGMGKEEKQLSETFGLSLSILICVFFLMTHYKFKDYSSDIQVLE